MDFKDSSGKQLRNLEINDNELSAVLDSVPIVVILVDEDVKVRKINDPGVNFVCGSRNEVLGQRAGRALRCLNRLDDPKGCGFGSECENCSLRNIVLDTFETGKSHYQEEAILPLERDGEKKEIAFLVSTVLIGLKDGKRVLLSIEDITEQKIVEKSLKHLSKTMAESVGQDFFDSIVEELCDWFGLDGAFVGEIGEDGETVSSLSMFLDGEKVEDYEYSLSGSPCSEVLEVGPCIFRENVTEKFPEDKDMKELGVEGYIFQYFFLFYFCFLKF